MKIKALIAVAALVAPGVASADAVAVALGASFQQVEVTTEYSGSFEGTAAGNVTIPGGVYSGETGETLWHDHDFSVTIPDQDVAVSLPVEGTYSGSVTTSRNELASISVAAAAGRNAVASAVANRHGSTGANSGASDSRSVRLSAEVDAGWGGYSSEVYIRD